MILKIKHEEAIIHLANYMFLTSSQFKELGLLKNRGDITNLLKEQTDRTKPLIGKAVMGFYPGKGRLEDIYYLTSYGKKFLIEELFYTEDDIKIPSNPNSISKRLYDHRKYTVDFHIKLDNWLKVNEGEIKFLTYDFEKVGNNRSGNKKETVKSINYIPIKTSYIIPDTIAQFEINNRDFLVIFEQHNGDNSKRLYNQLLPHLEALANGSIRKKYQFDKSHRVIVVCEYVSVKKSVIKRVQEDKRFNKFHKHFLFKTNDELEDDFFNNWTQLNGENINFIPS